MIARRAWASMVFAIALFVGAIVVPGSTTGAFSATTVNHASNLLADTLAPPTNLQVTWECQLLGILRPVANLSWTGSSSSWAEGYVLDRLLGTTLLESVPIADITTSLLGDGLLSPFLSLNTTYTWRLRTTYESWTSSDAVLSATSPLLCL